MIVKQKYLDYDIELQVNRIGTDISAICTGGSKIHIGGCALAVPYTNALGGTSASVSSISVPAHQDTHVAVSIANILCRRFKCIVCVQCGIHYECLTKRQVQDVVSIAESLCESVEDV